ncbi:uncharacterized protein LOC125498849 [Beta vulgaris subsp. vulgaris]|uniref:uncharacterized protein LOC125498849 n=1 Tax=Beta vulgaris subsp. vulgaris TaxID=3555 RepID=UPI002037288A|nr:uncharacterized protein LOC125498849 [Beta vulgaris subsp. vulgaris]
MPKWKLFIWKVWHNCLATSSNLHRRGVTDTNQCSICLHDDKDDQHLFRFCPLALEAWHSFGLQIPSSDDPSMSLASWIVFWLEKYIKEDGYRGLRVPMFIGTLWAIWKTRNDQVFRQIRATLEGFHVYVTESRHHHDHFLANNNPLSKPPPAPNCFSPPGFLMVDLGQEELEEVDLIIQIDGSWDRSNGHGGASWVATHHMNHIHSSGKFLHASSALHTEVMACLSALWWVIPTSFSSILIMTDSTLLIQNLEPGATADISILHMVSDIRATSGYLRSCRIMKGSRAQVRQAHEIANQCRMHRVNIG